MKNKADISKLAFVSGSDSRYFSDARGMDSLYSRNSAL